MEFRRFVSYVYGYQDQVKQQNCGFVRVEVRQNTVRFVLHMYLPGRQETEYKIYGFIRRKEYLEGILLGAGRMKNGNVDVGLQMPSEALGVGQAQKAEENISIEQLSGMIITGSDQTCYGTVWDDGEINMAAFKERAESADKTSGGAAERKARAEKPAEEKTEAQKEEKKEAAAEEKLPEEKPREKKLPEEKQQAEKPAEPPRGGEIHTEEYEEAVEWESIRNSCPSIVPFEGRDGIYFQIEPRHLKFLPRKLWHLGRNSFLLHGYYNYRYLILGQDKEGVILGIPGMYCPMEEHVASMFGFGTFVPAMETARRNGKFGYWCGRFING